MSTNSLRTLYFSLVYPYFFDCKLVWASTYRSNLVRLEILQKRPLPPLTIISVCDEEISRSAKAGNVGVIYDTSMSMEYHIVAICKAAFYHLRNIGRIRKYLSSQTAEVLVHAFVSSRLDYCNSLLYGLPKESLKKLQHVQNVAARIVTHTRKCDHITPVLCQLHWLPIEVLERLSTTIPLRSHNKICAQTQLKISQWPSFGGRWLQTYQIWFKIIFCILS